jgi:hypothetical protein
MIGSFVGELQSCSGILKFVCRACEDMAAGGGTDCRHIGLDPWRMPRDAVRAARLA